jgi:formate dehydrogenase major subunit
MKRRHQPEGRAATPLDPAKLRGATPVASVCPFCAVGCGQLVFVQEGRIVNIEGNPRSPINEGTLCPKGAATFQLVVNPNRLTRCLYRAPRASRWEERPLGWMMDGIAERVKATRDATFRSTWNGKTANHTPAIACLGGATLDNEENYLIKKLMVALGVVHVENQARI